MHPKTVKKKALLILAAMALVFPATALTSDKLHNTTHKGGIEKTVKENKEKKSDIPGTLGESTRIYSPQAKNNYSENDVKAFVYKWFAGFDHQAKPEYFTSHLDPARVDMAFPDFPIKSVNDFLRWYRAVVDTIRWNSHSLSGLTVTGSQEKGFSVSLDVRWQARTYDGQSYDMTVHQVWQVEARTDRQFIITRHRATLLP